MIQILQVLFCCRSFSLFNDWKEMFIITGKNLSESRERERGREGERDTHRLIVKSGRFPPAREPLGMEGGGGGGRR